MGGYLRAVAHGVLWDEYQVKATCGYTDSDCEVWDYERRLPSGENAFTVHTFDRGLAAYPPDTLKSICADLELVDEFEAIWKQIKERGGWVG